MDPKIKISDRVRLIKPSHETKRDYTSLSVGHEGIVVDTFGEIELDGNFKSAEKVYCIDWGKPIINGHNCNDLSQDGHGSWVGQEEIVKVL